MISEITKRNIVDELKLKNIQWSGRLDEVEFLNRLFDLEKLPSTDGRFENMRGDIWQHRINNLDWEDWWVFADERLNVFKDNDTFLKFVSEIIHPIVRNNPDEIKDLLNIFNSHLAPDGWKLVEKTRISGKPIFVAIKYKNNFDFRNEDKVSEKFSGDQLAKCDEKITRGDCDGAISSARSFLEGVFTDIHKRITDQEMQETGDLPKKFRRIKNLLKLSHEQFSDNSLKSLCGGFSSVIHSIDNLSNRLGDRHVPAIKAEEYQARFCINASKIIADFLYDRLHHLYQDQENIYEGLISALDTDNKRALTEEELKNDSVISSILEKCDAYVVSLLKKKFIDEYEIGSFRENDIFFAAMRLFFNELQKEDFKKILNKCRDNNQTFPPHGGLINFLSLTQDKNPDFLNQEHVGLIDKYKQKNIPF